MYKLVPEEATEETLEAGAIKLSFPSDIGRTSWGGMPEWWIKKRQAEALKVYTAMLDAAPSPWRPMAEAPKDGTYILARWANDRPTPAVVVFWRVDEEAWSDGYAYCDSQAFDGFIPLEWLGSPEEK